MNKYSTTAQYIGLLIVAGAINLFILLLALAFSNLSGWLVFAIKMPMVGICFYALLILADRYGMVFIIAMVCYITNAVLALVAAFVPNESINSGLMAFLGAANEILMIAATYFILTGLLNISQEIRHFKLENSFSIGRFVYLVVQLAKTMLVIAGAGDTLEKLARIIAIMMDVYILHLYFNLYTHMGLYRERRIKDAAHMR